VLGKQRPPLSDPIHNYRWLKIAQLAKGEADMDNANLISIEITRSSQRANPVRDKILLVKAPYFTPWTPPLGISILKSYLEQNGHSVRCYDYNTDAELWGMHHKYFTVLQEFEDVSVNDGYSKLWWILNSHMLSYANGADADTCREVLEKVISLYGVKYNDNLISRLIPLVEGFYKRLAELTDRIDLSNYSVIGTSTYTTSLGPSLFILRKAKQEHTSITTVMGGGVFADDLALGSDNLTTLIEEYPYVDHIVLGEGEMLFLKLLEGELAHKRVVSIADLKGATLNMKEVPLPDFSDLDPENYYHLTIEGARSCPFQCSFCSETIQWGDYRKKPIDLFADQVIELSKKFDNNTFFMGDSLMNPYIIQFSNALLEKKANVLYDGYLRADKPVTYRDKVRTWADSGCYRVRLGIESASENVLKIMDKKTTPNVISEALKTLAGAGIRTTTYWIVGFPGETEQDFQETCEFIKEHHRYIYELEAHPYYYYPYGQVGSRLYQCYSIYPEDVTNVTKFKVWEIIGANPTREERYKRLRRISELAAHLGLPNIYKMEQRYQAEDRWLRLHSLATEVYEGTRLYRKPQRLPHRPIELFSKSQFDEKAANAGSVLCYKAQMGKRLDETILLTSVERLIENNEMLRMRLQDGQYTPIAANDALKQELLSTHYFDEVDDAEFERFQRGIVGQLSAEMRPERGASVHVALTGVKEAPSLLLLAHRAVVDTKSVKFLLEDLFRIYEQLSHGKEISLRPIKKTYADFMEGLSAKRAVQAESFEKSTPLSSYSTSTIVSGIKSRSESEGRTVRLFIDRTLAEKFTSAGLAELGVKPAEVFVIALLRSLSGNEAPSVDVAIDFRLIDTSLEETVGALTAIYRLPESFGENAGLITNIKQAVSDLRTLIVSNVEHRAIRAGQPPDQKGRMLLNLEYFTEEAWLGGDDWKPEGFLLHKGSPWGEYLMEFMPVLTGDGIQVYLMHLGDPDMSKIAEAILNNLRDEIEAVIAECERYIAEMRFWQREFADYTAKPNIDVNASYEAAERGQSMIRFKAPKSALEDLQSECGVGLSSIILSAFTILLSRLSGREDVLIVLSLYEGTANKLAPIRLRPYWTSSFRNLAREVSSKISQATGNSAHVFDIIAREFSDAENDGLPPIFDVVCEFRESSKSSDIEESFKESKINNKAITLALVAEYDGSDLNLQFKYERACLSRDLIEKMCSYLTIIFDESAKNVDSLVGEIKIKKQETGSEKVQSLTGEFFNF
jgi:radical SAM superfamily enzyme YgiQ (UPF0313 family)